MCLRVIGRMRRDDVSDSFLYIRENPEEKYVESIELSPEKLWAVYRMIGWGLVVNKPPVKKCVAAISRHTYRQPSARWFPLWELFYVVFIMKMIYIGNKTRRKVCRIYSRVPRRWRLGFNQSVFIMEMDLIKGIQD